MKLYPKHIVKSVIKLLVLFKIIRCKFFFHKQIKPKIIKFSYRWVSSRRGVDIEDPDWQEAEKKLDRAWYNMGEGKTPYFYHSTFIFIYRHFLDLFSKSSCGQEKHIICWGIFYKVFPQNSKNDSRISQDKKAFSLCSHSLFHTLFIFQV